MSSGIDFGVSIVATAVMLPVGAAFNAGWLAWEAGKLIVKANAAADQEIEAKKRQTAEAEKHRRAVAIAGHDSLVELCRNLITEIDHMSGHGTVFDPTELESMKHVLLSVCEEPVPDDAARIEDMNFRGLIQAENIVNKQRRLSKVRALKPGDGEGLSAQELMERLSLAFSAAKIEETQGLDVTAAPQAVERATLNRRLADVTARITAALAFAKDLAGRYGLSDANKAWFQSCFNGADASICQLSSPVISNEELKKGIVRLEETMQQFDMLRPSIEAERQRIETLYPIYADTAKALGETVYQMRYFKTAQALEAEMGRLQGRAEKARQCAEIYRKLGPEAYVCYAWDEELRALGYKVFTRKGIAELAQYRPERARLEETELPFYQWDRTAMTQFYSITPQCSLQLIVHPDGSTTMQMISEPENREQTVETQKMHCDRLDILHRRLRENWFISCDHQVTAPAEEIKTAQAWRQSFDNKWTRSKQSTEPETGVRTNSRADTEKVMAKK